ncbi:MAG: c-type cytochrome [Gemmatimonadetes bacterium]|nr:c-type cytochrome [Gemmatimonadota bacterium]
MAHWGRSAVAAFAVMVAAACRGGEQAAPGAGAADTTAVQDTSLLPFKLTQQQAEGKIIFETMCWTCHGPSGHGDGPGALTGSVPKPPDFTTGDYLRLPPGALEARFAQRQHPTMQFVQSMLQPEVFAKALSYVPALSYPPEIPGSAIGGAQTYALRCVGCHGHQGTGNGPAARQLTLKPANFTQDTLIAKKDFEGLFRRIKEGGGPVHGSSMPPWGVLLSDREIWDLVAFIVTFQPGSVSPFPATTGR